MGHALDNTIQDIIIRFKRMDGYEALWLPGTDHASIATELKIVDQMKAEGLTKTTSVATVSLKEPGHGRISTAAESSNSKTPRHVVRLVETSVHNGRKSVGGSAGSFHSPL